MGKILSDEGKECLAKWFDKGREWGQVPMAKDLLTELEVDAEKLIQQARQEVAREMIGEIEKHVWYKTEIGSVLAIGDESWQTLKSRYGGKK